MLGFSVSLGLFFFQLYGRDEEGALARVISQKFLSTWAGFRATEINHPSKLRTPPVFAITHLWEPGVEIRRYHGSRKRAKRVTRLGTLIVDQALLPLHSTTGINTSMLTTPSISIRRRIQVTTTNTNTYIIQKNKKKKKKHFRIDAAPTLLSTNLANSSLGISESIIPPEPA